MAERFPGGVISKTPPTVTPPTGGEGGSASGVWTLDEQLGLQKAGNWPQKVLPRELYAWGGNSNGQLGDNTAVNRSSPVQIGLLTTWEKVSCGNTDSTATKSDGTFWAWGYNYRGQLGDGTTIRRSSPVQIGALTNWLQPASGFQHTLSIKADNTLWAWGRNNKGQLGHNNTVYLSSPVQVGSLAEWSIASAGRYHNTAIKTDGTLWAWGYNASGNLGDDTIVSKSSPVQIGALTNWYEVSSSLNGRFNASIKTDGTLWVWGQNQFGQLGDNTTANTSSPIQVGAFANWSSSSARGSAHTTAVKDDGTLWAWGFNERGQLGHNNTVYLSSPVQVGALTTWESVNNGHLHSLVKKTDGTLWAWGYSGVGRLGDNANVNRSSPVQVGASANWAQFAGGGFHTLAILKVP